jgi:hypothetical protein
VDWIHLAQDRAQWRDLVSMVMNLLGIIKGWGIFRQVKKLLASQNGFHSKELVINNNLIRPSFLWSSSISVSTERYYDTCIGIRHMCLMFCIHFYKYIITFYYLN